jgi:hypothetical protein
MTLLNQNKTISIPLCTLLLLLGQCKQKYVSPYSPPVTPYLVVEGNIAGNAPMQVALSRVIHLPGDSAIPMVTQAKVQVEGTDNSVYPLTETSTGIYTTNNLPLTTTAKYRLRISTPDGETYLSDPATYEITPAIDSINWIQTADGVTIYANTHDPANSTRYYQWQYTETWQYNSAEISGFVFRDRLPARDTVVERPDSEQIYSCYQNENSTPLLLGSSIKLAQDVIYRQKMQFIPDADQKLSVLYSIIVSQHALTEDAYNFLTLMKSNSESLGTIFDAQPSELRGNIHSLTHPDEQVIGYVTASTVQTQRIYIRRSQLNDWGYINGCDLPDTAVDLGSIDHFFLAGGFTPVRPIPGPFGPSGYFANSTSCIDCRTQGGKTTKPAFWPQ